MSAVLESLKKFTNLSPAIKLHPNTLFGPDLNYKAVFASFPINFFCRRRSGRAQCRRGAVCGKEGAVEVRRAQEKM